MNPFQFCYNYGKNVLTNRQFFWHLFGWILLAECILGILIIHFVPCMIYNYNILKIDTEIDWKAYMDEVAGAMYTSLDYTKLRGETGKIELKMI